MKKLLSFVVVFLVILIGINQAEFSRAASTFGTSILQAYTSLGTTPYHLANGTGATTNSTSVKSSAGNLMSMVALNTTITLYYLKVYDSAGAPTCSSATGLKHVFPIPPAASAGQAAGFVVPLAASGESYASGIGFCVTGGGADTDASNAATGVFIEGSYK